MSCSLDNFESSKHSSVVLDIVTKLSENDYKTIDDLITDIEIELKGKPFSSSLDESLDKESYNDSLDNLAKEFLSCFEASDKKLFEINRSNKTEFKRKFIKALNPQPLTDLEKAILPKIAGTELIREDERHNIKFNRAVNFIYKNNPFVNTQRQAEFGNEILRRTIINGKTLVGSDPESLNTAMMEYQKDMYNTLRSFLIEVAEFDGSLFSQGLYRKNIRYAGADKVLTAMYNYINKAIKDKTFELDLEDSYIAHVMPTEDDKKLEKDRLYLAVSAYVNLAYFDDSLKESLGDYIAINYKQRNPIEAIPISEYDEEYTYRYSFSRGNSNAIKSWGIEEHDSLKEMSKFQLILIGAIPVMNYETKGTEYGYMDSKMFVGSVSKLLDVAHIVTDIKFRNIFSSFHDHPRRQFELLLRELFRDNNVSLLDELDTLGVTSQYINYLYSIYHTVFSGSNSWKVVENNYIKVNGLTEGYSLVDTLLGVADSNVVVNYVQTLYNRNTEKVETTVKSRYVTNRTKFDITDNVNNTIRDWDITSRQKIINKYKVKEDKNRKDYTITIPIGTQTLTLSAKPKSGIENILFVTGTGKESLSIPLLSLFKDIDVSSKNNRSKLLSGVGLTETERLFMAVLEFIDDLLQTSFSRNENSLNEFNLLMRLNRGLTNFNLVLSSAIRAAVVNNIYYKLQTTKKEDDNYYSLLEVEKFLADHPETFGSAILDLNNNAKRRYFKKTHLGNQFKIVSNQDVWTDRLAYIRSMLNGETNKSVIPNFEGAKVANYSPSYEGARINQTLARSVRNNGASSSLLFVQKPRAIRALTVNSDIKTKDGKSKNIKDLTLADLLYDMFINKFVIPYSDASTEQSIYVQPTVYSDKTKFIMYKVSLMDLGIDLKKSDFEDKVIGMIISTIGDSYKRVWKQVVDDYKQIFKEFVVGDNLNLDLVERWLNTHKRKDLVDKAHKAGIAVYNDLHFRELSSGLSLNELLYNYATNLYTENNLRARLKTEEINYVNDLLKNRVSFKVAFNDKGEIDYADPLMGMLHSLSHNKSKDWISGNRMVLAKVKDKNGKIKKVTYGLISSSDTVIEVNPILHAYFLVDNLVGNNLRFSLTGSEVNHKIKKLPGIKIAATKAQMVTVEKLHPMEGNPASFYNIASAINLYDLFVEEYNALLETRIQVKGNQEQEEAIDIAEAQLFRDYSLDSLDIQNMESLKKLYNELIYKVENLGQNAQFKRNVAAPATMRYFLLGTINGIRNKMKVAVIKDLPVQCYNYTGESKNIDSHDGSALVNPFSSLLENWSLLDCEVGTVKKPLWHWYDDKYMTATLLKYATDTITNLWMRLAEGNSMSTNKLHGITLYNLFKKMTNERWSGNALYSDNNSWKYGKVDLINGCGFKNRPHISFNSDIMKNVPLYYRSGGHHRKIKDFNRTADGVYYTVECITTDGVQELDETNVYHYFTELGEHIKSNRILSQEEVIALNLHTIDSLFELHAAFGSIYSETFKDGIFEYSEASNLAVARYINNVAILKDGADENDISQDSYHQPLKYAMIDTVANETAVKNGAGNMNEVSSFFDNTPLKFIEVGTLGYGILLNSDHTADEAQMTEFSLVISALDTGGRLHGYISEVYKALGLLSLELSSVEISAVKAFLAREEEYQQLLEQWLKRKKEAQDNGLPFDEKEPKIPNITEIYDVVGRTIINNLSRNRGLAGLAEAIIEAIQDTFNLNADHDLDEIKIPFSDPSVYSSILSSFVSTINNKSIKHKYSGSGTVMVPGYKMSMIYELGNEKYQFEDILRMALEAGYTSSKSDLSLKHRDIVQQYLRDKLAQIPFTSNNDIYMPTDNVRISYVGEQFNFAGLDYSEVEWEENLRTWKDSKGVSHTNRVVSIYLKGLRSKGCFELVKDIEDKYYSVHFKTGNADTREIYGSTSEERNILYKNLYALIPDGAFVSTYGNVSDGGEMALNKLMSGNVVIGERTVSDRDGNPKTINIFLKAGTYLYSQNSLEIRLDDILDYYLFKGNIEAFLAKHGIHRSSNILYLKNVMAPRDLAPAKISFSYTDALGTKHNLNIYDTWAIRELYVYIALVESDKKLSKDLKIQLINNKRTELQPFILKIFDGLNKGVYYLGPNDNQGVTIDGLVNIPAEVIMSNLYASKFGLKHNTSLAEVKALGRDAFIPNLKVVESDNYDMVYTRGDGEHLYITLSLVLSEEGDVDSDESLITLVKFSKWENIIRKEFKYPQNYVKKEGDPEIVYELYEASRDNVPLFKVGRAIVNNNVAYNTKLRKFVDKNDTTKVLPNLTKYQRYGSKVLELIFFMSNNTVRENGKTYRLYNINPKNAKRVLLKRDYSEKERTYIDKKGVLRIASLEDYFNKEVSGFISKLMADVYKSLDFEMLQLNSRMSVNSHLWLKYSLYNMGKHLSYDNMLREYIQNKLYPIIDKAKEGEEKGIIEVKGLRRASAPFALEIANRKYSSFLLSLKVTASRIPAQNLQSFMLMENVGFTGVPNAQCFVSVWLTWLQGSDYGYFLS